MEEDKKWGQHVCGVCECPSGGGHWREVGQGGSGHSNVLFSTLLGTAWERGCRAEREQLLALCQPDQLSCIGPPCNIAPEQDSEAKKFGHLWSR